MRNEQLRRAWESEDLSIFRETVRRFFSAELVAHDERWRKQGYVDRDFYLKAGSAGLLCPSIPEEFGGGGGTFAHEAILQEELASLGCTSFAQGVHGTICAHYLLAYGNDEQRQRWLPKLCSGEWIAALAMTEPTGGSDLQALRTRATRVENSDHYVLNGSKTFISNGQTADIIIVAAKTGAVAGANGISLVVVEAGATDGFYRGPILKKVGMQGQDTSELYFEDLLVPIRNRLGAEGDGFLQMMEQLTQERLVIAVFCQALMEQASLLTINYVKERKVFGSALIDLQNTRFKLAECETVARVSRAFVDECIAKHLESLLSPTDASMAKYWCSEQLCRVIDECVQLHGGYGYMLEYPIARMYVDARVQRIYGGANEVMKELVARSL
jgi:acyl-CoA dehydrogenase